jgi:hypothetical protein
MAALASRQVIAASSGSARDIRPRDSALAEALQAICDLDLSELQAIIPPRGFGRD